MIEFMIKKCLFASLMLFACSAYGITDNNQNGRPGNPGHIYSVPDTGSTVFLLGLSVIVLAVGTTFLRKA